MSVNDPSPPATTPAVQHDPCGRTLWPWISPLVRGDGDTLRQLRDSQADAAHAVVACAEKHGLAAWLLSRLDAFAGGLGDWPEQLRDVALARALLERGRVSAFDQALAVLYQAGEADGGGGPIEPIALKGVAIAERFWGGGEMRPSRDHDLLIRPREMARAVAALRSIGYHGPDRPPLSMRLGLTHHVALRRPHDGSLIELHTRPYVGFGIPWRDASWFERASTYPRPTGVPVRTLDAPDEMIFLAAHAASSLWVRLAWLVDLALIATRWREVAGEAAMMAELTTRARELNGRPVLAAASELVGQYMGDAYRFWPREDPRTVRKVARALQLAADDRATDPVRRRKLRRNRIQAILADGPYATARAWAFALGRAARLPFSARLRRSG